MFHPTLVAQAISRLQADYHDTFLHEIPQTSIADCHARQRDLDEVYPERDHYHNVLFDRPVRALTIDERRFIRAEVLWCRASFRYWAERYVRINRGGAALEPLFPLWESQDRHEPMLRGRCFGTSLAGEMTSDFKEK